MLAPVLKCCSAYISLHLCWMIGKNWLVFFLMTLPTILGVFVTLKFRFCLVPYNFFVCDKMELRQLIVSECVGLPKKIARYVLALSIFCQNILIFINGSIFVVKILLFQCLWRYTIVSPVRISGREIIYLNNFTHCKLTSN